MGQSEGGGTGYAPSSVRTCSGQPYVVSACTSAVHAVRPVARGTTAAITQYRNGRPPR